MNHDVNDVKTTEADNNEHKTNGQKSNFAKIGDRIRNGWKIGSLLEVYSESRSQWLRGNITKIYNDKEGEWLVVKYGGSIKEVQRYNDCVRPLVSLHELNKKQKKRTFSMPKTLKCPHNDTSIEYLSGLSLRDRKVCSVRGLPSFANENLLKMDKWYGQFEGIQSVTINNKENDNESAKDSISALITFDNEQSAIKAIEFSNKCTFTDGRKLTATFGISTYCKHFLAKHGKCLLANCAHKHEWAEAKDVLTSNDINAFTNQECGLALKDKKRKSVNNKQLQALFDENAKLKQRNQSLLALNHNYKNQYESLQRKYKEMVRDKRVLQNKYDELKTKFNMNK